MFSLLLALLLCWAPLPVAPERVLALAYYPAGPRGSVGIRRPVIYQQFSLAPGEAITAARMWLDGMEVRPVWDGSGRVSYTPEQDLAPGEHTVRLDVQVAPASPGFYYDPVVSTYTFTVAADAAPAYTAPGPEELRALQRVNRYRQAAGLPPMHYAAALGMAAERHARYLAANPAVRQYDAHQEVPGTPLYFGGDGLERARYFGYGGAVSEVINFTHRAEEAVDGWIDTLYHRIPLLDPAVTEMGYGVAADGRQPINVLLTGAYGTIAGEVRWPVPDQQQVPTYWDGAEVPDPLRLYPGVPLPVGYPVTLTFGGEVRALRLTGGTLTGPEGAVAVLLFHPGNDDHLTDTVALIPRAPLQPGTRYTVTFTGEVDLGQGPRPFTRTWSFTTAAAQQPLLDQAVSLVGPDGAVVRWRVEGYGFGPDLRVFLGGLPVRELTVADTRHISFRPPLGSAGGDLLVVGGGREALWPDFLADRPAVDKAAFTPVELTVHGRRLGNALRHATGALLLPEPALTELGARPVPVAPIGRTYWSFQGRTGDYTLDHAMAVIESRDLLLDLPVQRRDGQVYVDAAFVAHLAGPLLQIQPDRVDLGLSDLGDHWARETILRLLQESIVSGGTDGRFRPDEPLTRAAFVKMLIAGQGVALRPGDGGGFADTGSHWVSAQGYLGAAVRSGVVRPEEYPAGHFEPDRPITREEMAVMVVRALGLDGAARARKLSPGPVTLAGKTFADAAAWRRPGYIAVAVEQGIITGYREPDGTYTFRPAAQATRAEAAVMVARALE
jgi:uncharacterized protein YkwD